MIDISELAKLKALAQEHHDDMILFCRRLIQTPSLSGQEGEVAELVRREMETLGYDEVWIDAVGNVIGKMCGGEGPSVMLNCHLDHVAPGHEQQWLFPPYSGEIYKDHIWGRGASDTKGALAPQVYALGALRKAGLQIPGDVYVTGVVQEEVGGLGMDNLLKDCRTDVAILGEATSNRLARGHRGRGEIIARIYGQAAHASVPEQGVNPHQVAARFLLKLEEVSLGRHPELGASTLAPTLYLTDQTSRNVIPGQVDVHLDWRLVPGDQPEELVEELRRILDECLIPNSRGEVNLMQRSLQTYTGHQQTMPVLTRSYLLPKDHRLLRESQAILSETLEREIPVGEWRFGTDGGHTMKAGIPTIGFSPCEEHLAHTSEDRVSITLMTESLVGYMALALYLGARLERETL
jgi:succinyl-diaminopimelate desuccinylase